MLVDGEIDLSHIGTPSNPAAGRSKFFVGSDNIPRILTPAGVTNTAAGTRWGTTNTWHFADSTDVNATMYDGFPPRVGDLLISTNGFSYGDVHPITAVYVSGNVDIGLSIFNIRRSDTGWVNVSFAAGWANYGSGFETCQYRKIDDFLYMKGLIKRTGANAAAQTGMFTLPVGSRPIGGWVAAAWGFASAAELGMALYITPAGVVSCSSHTINTNGYMYLDVPPSPAAQ